jgi:large conductance mechanosensitive channel
MLAEFKAFAFKGNMIDLAIAVVIGAAFSNVIHAVVTDIINPAISYAVTGVKEAGNTASSVTHSVESKIGVTTQPVAQGGGVGGGGGSGGPAAGEPANAINFDWKIGRFLVGDFLGAIINFIIQAFAVFILIVKLSGTVVKKVSRPSAPGEPTTKECPFCLSVIPIKATKCAHCTAELPGTVSG